MRYFARGEGTLAVLASPRLGTGRIPARRVLDTGPRGCPRAVPDGAR